MFEKVKKAIQDELAIEPGEITKDSKIDELGIDSLETTEIVMNIEDQTGISVPDDLDVSGDRKIKDIANDLQEIADGSH